MGDFMIVPFSIIMNSPPPLPLKGARMGFTLFSWRWGGAGLVVGGTQGKGFHDDFFLELS